MLFWCFCWTAKMRNYFIIFRVLIIVASLLTLIFPGTTSQAGFLIYLFYKLGLLLIFFGPGLAVLPRLLQIQSSCFRFQAIGITGMCHHGRLYSLIKLCRNLWLLHVFTEFRSTWRMHGSVLQFLNRMFSNFGTYI